MSESESITPAYTGASYVVPTHSPEGAPLSAQETIAELGKIPAFVDGFMQPHSPESRLMDTLNRRAVAEAEALPVPAPAARPEAFVIPYEHGYPEMDQWTPEQAAADTTMRGWLSAADLDAQTGNAVAELVAERAAHWAKQSDWSNAAQESEAALREIYGADFPAKVESAQAYVALIESRQPGFGRFLNNTGLGNDPHFVHQMILLAEARGC